MNLFYFYDKKVSLKYSIICYIIPLLIFIIMFTLYNVINGDFSFYNFLKVFFNVCCLFTIEIFISCIYSVISSKNDKIVKEKGIVNRCPITLFEVIFFKFSYQGIIEFEFNKDLFTIMKIYPDENFKKMVCNKDKYYIDIYKYKNRFFADLKSISSKK